MDELDLGIPPSRKRVLPLEPKPVDGIVWRKYAARERRLCDDCMAETPTVGGVPIHAVNRAFYQRKAGSDINYYCAPHHQARLLAEGKK